MEIKRGKKEKRKKGRRKKDWGGKKRKDMYQRFIYIFEVVCEKKELSK